MAFISLLVQVPDSCNSPRSFPGIPHFCNSTPHSIRSPLFSLSLHFAKVWFPPFPRRKPFQPEKCALLRTIVLGTFYTRDDVPHLLQIRFVPSIVYKLFKMDLRWRMVVLSGARSERDGSVTGRVIYCVQKEPECRRPTRIRGGGFECEESEPYPQEGTCNPGNRNDRRRSGRPRPEIGLISIFVIPHGLITITPLLVPSYGLRFAHVMPAHMSSWRADSRMANSLEVRKPAKETKAGLRGSSKQISGNTPSNPGTVPKGERVLLSLLTGMMKIHSRSNNTLRNYYESKLLKSP